MPSLTNRTVASSYTELLKLNETNGLTDALARVEDGDGTQSALSVSTLKIRSDGDLEVTGASSLWTLDVTETSRLRGNVTMDGDLAVAGNAVIQGTLTANGGTLTLGDADTDNVVFNADVNSHILPNTDNTYDLGSASKSWRNLHVDTTATINNISITGSQTITATTQSTNKDTGALVVEGGVGVEKNVNVGGDLGVVSNTSLTGTLGVTGATTLSSSLAVTGNTTMTGDLAVNGGDLTTNQTTFNLLNATATTLNVGGAATTMELGAATGTTNVNNNLVVDLDLQVKGGDITTDQTTFNLLNTTATTLNVGGAATTVEIGAASGTTNVNNNLDVDGDLNIDGGNLTVSTATFNLANATATTVNAFGAGTSVNLGAVTGTTTVRNNAQINGTLGVTGAALLSSTLGVSDTISATKASGTGLAVTANATVGGDLTVTGNLTVNGTTTNINTTNLVVEDKNVILGDVASPTDITADGGGITLKGATDKTLNWVDATDAWTSSEHLNLASAKEYRIAGNSVLSASTLGSGVTASSLTSVGTIGTGVWQGTIVSPTYGGTGVNNSNRTITLGGNLTTSGAFNTTLTATANTSVTLPTTGTLATLANTETLTNKTINLTNNTLVATSAQVASAVTDETGSGALVFGTSPTLTTPTISSIVNTGTLTLPTSTDTLVGRATTDTLTNKTINLSNNTLTATSAQIAAAVSDETGSGALVFGTSPTLTTPIISSIVNTGTLTLPTSTDTLVGRATTDTLTNTTLTSPTINTPVMSVNDADLTIQDNADPTKKAKFEASGISAGQTRTYTLPNVSMNVVGYTTAGTPAWTIDQTFAGFLNLTLANGTTVKVPYYS